MKKIVVFFKSKKNIALILLSFLSIFLIFQLNNFSDKYKKLEDKLTDTKSDAARYDTMFQYVMRFDSEIALDAIDFWLHKEDVKSPFDSSIDYSGAQVLVSEPIEDKDLLESSGKDYEVAYKFEVEFTNPGEDYLFVDIKDFFLFDSEENIIAYDSYSMRDDTESIGDKIYVGGGKVAKINIIFGAKEKISKKHLKFRYKGGQWQYPQ
ncbi:TPA: hypothetical protein U1Y54_000389 [Streptococcus suis]|nr:hypothetical protein [Streptococcus suis]